ncbi:MAG: DsbA family protein [Alphaproteobacteria bacterium]
MIVLLLFYNHPNAQDIDNKIEEFLLNNPEVILQSLKNYEERMLDEGKKKNKDLIKNNKDIIFNSKNGLYSGSVNSKKVIVEFLDYNCSYCKRGHQDIKKVLKEHPDIKVIYKNFPILSDQSLILAKMALVIAKKSNKKFNNFHDKLLKTKGFIDNKKIKKILLQLDYDLEKIKKEIDNPKIEIEVERDIELARMFELKGTPAFLIKDEVIFGYIDHKEITKKISGQQ